MNWTGYDPLYDSLQRKPRVPPKPDAPTKDASWRVFTGGSLVYWMIAFNLLGATAHGVGVALTLAQGRWDIALATYRSEPVNLGNATHVNLARVVNHVGRVYPTQIVFLFFALSLTFHLVITLVLLLSLAIPDSGLVSWYMRGLWYGVAPWVRCSHYSPPPHTCD